MLVPTVEPAQSVEAGRIVYGLSWLAGLDDVVAGCCWRLPNGKHHKAPSLVLSVRLAGGADTHSDNASFLAEAEVMCRGQHWKSSPRKSHSIHLCEHAGFL